MKIFFFHPIQGVTKKEFSCGTFAREKSIEISRKHKIHSRFQWLAGSIAHGRRHLILYTFALDRPPGNERTKNQEIGISKNKSKISKKTFFQRS